MEIDNNKICVKDKNNTDKYKLKSGLVIQKDYYAINQYLWEWFKLNYGGGPEITIGISNNNNVSNNKLEKSESLIDNNNSVIGINSKENFFESCKSNDSQLKSIDTSCNIRDSVNKVNSVNAYKFNTKFNDFRIHNEKAEESTKKLQKKERYIDDDNDYIMTFGNINIK